MNTPFALAASVLAVLVWLLSRRRPGALLQPQPHLPVSSPSASAALVQPAAGATLVAAAATPPARDRSLPPSRSLRLRQLAAQLSASPEQRLEAIEQLAAWPDRAILPLLRRSLRDPHPAVAHAAACAINRFRGRTSACGSVADPGSARRRRLPRNAAGRP